MGRHSTPHIAPEFVDVLDAIADVTAILPHAVERKIPYRARLAFEPKRKRRYAHLNDRAFLDRYVFKGLENALFVFSSDGHEFARLTPLDSRVTDPARHFFSLGNRYRSIASLPGAFWKRGCEFIEPGD